MPHLWIEVRSAKTALAGPFELLALRARTVVTRHLRNDGVATVFADEVDLLGDHDLELVPVNTVRTAYGVHRVFASPQAFFCLFRFLASACASWLQCC